jgi:hypothetical protein
MLSGDRDGAIRAADDGTSGSKGFSVPKSMTNPVFLEPLLKVTVVPSLMQKALLDLASGKSGVEVA